MKLTQEDLGAIKNLIDVTIEEKDFVRKSDLAHLPTRDEFYEKMDEVLKEVKDSREEQTILSGRISNHEDRLQVVEEKLQIN